MTDLHGHLVATITANTFYVGTTGIPVVGVRLKFTVPVPVDRFPDFVIDETTSLQQAMIYRLSGDYNPLHIDPDVSRAFGYEKPILHGLCTLGIATRIVIQTCANSDVTLLSKVACRFSRPTYPGRVLRVQIWKTSSDSCAFRVIDLESGSVVLDQGLVEFKMKATPRL
jgi:3-hydroxyacyl-CoA dehydrogenase/3a,7a,12a-trihydroxy-5b-cholest-24-enoyl-CoA hydratase